MFWILLRRIIPVYTRGHYDNDESLRSYFKAMMWYGRITFRLKDEDETKSAALMTLALGKNDNLQKWDKYISRPASLWVKATIYHIPNTTNS